MPGLSINDSAYCADCSTHTQAWGRDKSLKCRRCSRVIYGWYFSIDSGEVYLTTTTGTNIRQEELHCTKVEALHYGAAQLREMARKYLVEADKFEDEATGLDALETRTPNDQEAK